MSWRRGSGVSVITETLPNSNANFTVKITDNTLTASEGSAVMESTGVCGAFSRSLRVTVEQSQSGFIGMGASGPIVYDGNVYVNGIKSIGNPQPADGWLYSNNDISARDNAGKVYCNGKISSGGNVGDGVSPSYCRQSQQQGINNSFPTFPKDKYTTEKQSKGEFAYQANSCEQFYTDYPVSNGVCELTQSSIVNNSSDDLHIEGDLKVKNKSVFWVKGNLKVDGNITGDGYVIVNGKTSLKGGKLDTDNKKNTVVLYSEKDIMVAHPEVDRDADGKVTMKPGANTNPLVSDFFAQMPSYAPAQISSTLPDSSKAREDFFGWFNEEYDKYSSASDRDKDPKFRQWYEGEKGNPAYPGLPENVKGWLVKSKDIKGDLKGFTTSGITGSR